MCKHAFIKYLLQTISGVSLVSKNGMLFDFESRLNLEMIKLF